MPGRRPTFIAIEMVGSSDSKGGTGFVGGTSGKNSQAKATGDFNCDGKSGILLLCLGNEWTQPRPGWRGLCCLEAGHLLARGHVSR